MTDNWLVGPDLFLQNYPMLDEFLARVGVDPGMLHIGNAVKGEHEDGTFLCLPGRPHQIVKDPARSGGTRSGNQNQIAKSSR